MQSSEKMSETVITSKGKLNSKSALKLDISKKLNFDVPCERIPEIVSVSDVETLIEKVSCDSVESIEYSIQPYSKEKLGFLGSHLRLELTTKTQRLKQTRKYNFFLKVIPYHIPSQAIFIQESKVFEKEVLFFKNIVPELNYEYLGEKWGPTSYLIKENVLIFEDLRDKGLMMTRDKFFDKELITSALTSIAHLHAASIIAEERLKQPINLIYSQAFEGNPFGNTARRLQWFQAGIDVAVFLAEQLGLNSRNIPAACKKACDAFKPSLVKRNVVSHGDLWGNNLLFDEGSPKKCVLVDFQLLRYSPLAHDVTQLLYLCSTREFRQTYENEMIKHYFAILHRVLKKNNSEIDVPPWTEFLQGVEEQRLCGIVTAAIFFPTVLLDGETGAQIFNDPNSYDKFVFHDRRDTVFSIMQRDVQYATRIKEVIQELVEFAGKLEQIPKPT